ncbi:hypothetical protein [Methylobacterium sp. yr668]|uniref:hypothetical protein n=1 Tax=Methylobacterium sp. yr668 TaxID=1761801 RepID=UPI0008EB9AF0|nr:hypothetical protein [Methylobacterium sp. yr668]SFT24725.1 hypothetical protein SAMN04487845_13055 [Methylobacterium sp. yr668]
MRRTKPKLPDSLTQPLSDPKIVAFRPRAKQRSPYRMSGSAQKIAVSVVTLIVVVLAGGFLLRLW